MSQIAVIDSGSGNLRSVVRALERAGGRPEVTCDPRAVLNADRIVVPGQGAFGDCVSNLRERGLDDAIREFIAGERPYLGICLGLQVLFESSEEHGAVTGLGILPGRVVRFQTGVRETGTDRVLKVPHMGWNKITPSDPLDPILADDSSSTTNSSDDPGQFYYFVHSYYVLPTQPDLVAATCDYGTSFTAAIRRDNVFACQFHPEKSQAAGLRLLSHFVEAT